jgi:4-amino-4-deoxychorismate lyase
MPGSASYMLECLVDGEISDRISVADRGLQYGDGLFETIAVHSGQPRLWQGHMDRLSAGCERLGLIPPPQAVLLRELQTVSAGQGSCVVKIIVTRGISARGYASGSPAEVNRLVISYPWPEVRKEWATTGMRAKICDLRLGIQPAFAGIKHLNRLEQVMARAEWRDPEIHEGILLDREDHVISGVASNIFLVFGDRILTPRLDRCGVRGILRSAILAAFREQCEQRRIMLDMIPDADEVFLSSTVRGVFPVTRIENWEYDAGPVTRRVQEWLNGQ